MRSNLPRTILPFNGADFPSVAAGRRETFWGPSPRSQFPLGGRGLG